MTHPAIPVLVHVESDGTVRRGSVRYWSLGSLELSGQQVRMLGPLPGDEHIILQPLGGSDAKVRAWPFALVPAGFVEDAANRLTAERVVACRRGLGRRSVIDADSAGSANRIGMGLKHLRRVGKAILAKLCGVDLSKADRVPSNRGISTGGGGDVGQHEVFESLDTVGERGCTQEQSPNSGDHNGFADDLQRIADRIFHHRLSEASE